MSDDLIRPHDPFSGHVDPAPADDTIEPVKPPEPPTPPQEPVKKPVARKTPARRGRRPRRVPTDAEVAEAARKVKP